MTTTITMTMTIITPPYHFDIKFVKDYQANRLQTIVCNGSGTQSL